MSQERIVIGNFIIGILGWGPLEKFPLGGILYLEVNCLWPSLDRVGKCHNPTRSTFFPCTADTHMALSPCEGIVNKSQMYVNNNPITPVA